jgi:Family of unknown function (DUF6056)
MPAKSGQNNLTKSQTVVFTIACLALTAVFFGYIVIGTFMRMSGDDYCYNAVEGEQGFWRTQGYSYLYGTVFGSNGYSLTLASSLSSEVGTISSRLLPGLVLILWLIGGYLLVRGVSRILVPEHSSKRGFQILETLLVAGIITFFTLYLAPNLTQSLYWRSGLLTYLMPLTFITYMTAFFISVVQIQSQKWWTWTTLFLLAFVGGGFSEAVTPMQLGLYSLVLVSVLAMSVKRRRVYTWILKPLSATMIGTILALVIMFLSPVNHLRQQGLPPSPGFVRLVVMSLENAFVFYKISLYKQLLPNVLCGLTALAISYIVYIRQPEQTQRRLNPFPITRVILVSLGLIIAGYLLIVCVMAPVAYGESSYPDLRTLIAPRWIMVIQIISLGWLAGWILSRWLKARPGATQLTTITAMIIILGVGVLAITAAKNIYAQIPQYQRWAMYWDKRNDQILQAKQEGQTVVQVMEIDHMIQGVSELGADPFFWYNVCAARYYGIERIYANQPGWDQ